jgi:hypothetical protein
MHDKHMQYLSFRSIRELECGHMYTCFESLDILIECCWSMGHPCSIQRGLARRLCILLVCTDPISALALQTSIGYGTTNLNKCLGVRVSLRGVRVRSGKQTNASAGGRAP